jgi:pantoate--beta-alanine ligase
VEAAGPCAIEYVSLVDAETLAPLEQLAGRARLCVAVRIDGTRLIDNLAIDPPTGGG